MSRVELVGDNATRKLNELARHQMIKRLLQDILFDLAVCEIEGWDKREYINDICKEVQRLAE